VKTTKKKEKMKNREFGPFVSIMNNKKKGKNEIKKFGPFANIMNNNKKVYKAQNSYPL
jgi:hypothetical protein